MNRLVITALLLSGCGGAAFEVADAGAGGEGVEASLASPPAPTGPAPVVKHPDGSPAARDADAGGGPDGDVGDAGAAIHPAAEASADASEVEAPETPDADAAPPELDAPAPPPKDAGSCPLEPSARLFCGSGTITGPAVYCQTALVSIATGTWTYTPTPTPAECQCAGAFHCGCLADAGLCGTRPFHCSDVDGGGPVPWCS
jgi:hypothetical protein